MDNARNIRKKDSDVAMIRVVATIMIVLCFVIKIALWVVVVFGVCAIVDIVCSKIFEMVEKKLLKNVFIPQRHKINDWMNT